MTLSFGASTFSFLRQEQAIRSMRRLREIGYRRIDVLVVPGHLWPRELDARARSALRRDLERDDIVVDSLNPQPIDLNIGSCVAEVRDYSVTVYTETIRLAAELGARGVVVVPGRVPPALPPAAEDTLRWTADSVAALAEQTRAAGLEVLLLENHPSTAFPTAAGLSGLMDRVGAGNVRVAYDVANAEYLGEDQVEAIRLLGDRIGQTHLSDATPGGWAHDVPGSGSVRFDAVLGELAGRGSTATNIVELVSPDPLTDYLSAARALDVPLPG